MGSWQTLRDRWPPSQYPVAKIIARDYTQALGQLVNRDQMSMIFSKNVRRQVKNEIMALWNITKYTQYYKYLGLPSVIGRSRMNTLAKIKQKVWKKIKTWKENLLSQRDKEILIKATALAIPTYTISCFKLFALSTSS